MPLAMVWNRAGDLRPSSYTQQLSSVMRQCVSVPEEDVSGLASWARVDQLLFQGLEGAVVDVDGAAGSCCVGAALLRHLSAERDVTVSLLRLHKLNAVLLLWSWTLWHKSYEYKNLSRLILFLSLPAGTCEAAIFCIFYILL